MRRPFLDTVSTERQGEGAIQEQRGHWQPFIDLHTTLRETADSHDTTQHLARFVSDTVNKEEPNLSISNDRKIKLFI